jgi:hypothetical protein
MRKYRFTSAALFELREGALYYEQKEKGLGIVFGTRCQHEPDAAALIASPSSDENRKSQA